MLSNEKKKKGDECLPYQTGGLLSFVLAISEGVKEKSDLCVRNINHAFANCVSASDNFSRSKDSCPCSSIGNEGAA